MTSTPDLPSARELHDAVWALLEPLTGINLYDGEVPKTPPLDADGRVHAYAVLYAFPGVPLSLLNDDVQDSLDSGFQVTCVGGDPTRALGCLDKVRRALVGAEVELDGVIHRITASETGPGRLERDDNISPPRHYVPALFDVFIP